MSNIAQVIAALAEGKGVYRGDALFLMADGQVVDKDGKEVIAANALGAAAYTSFPGYLPSNASLGDENPLSGAIIQVDVVAETKPSIFYWHWVQAGENKLYDWESGAYVDITDDKNFVESDTEPATPTEGDFWYDTVSEMLMRYETDAFAEIVDAYISSATEPTVKAVGYTCVDLTLGDIFVAEAGLQGSVDWDSGTLLTAGKIYTDGSLVAIGTVA